MTPSDGTFALSLSLLPGCGQHRLRSLLQLADDGVALAEVWDLIVSGRLAERHPAVVASLGRGARDLLRRWATAAATLDPMAAWAGMRAAHISLTLPADDAYPAVLRSDPDPPALLFRRGDLSVLRAPAVAIVGTRRCTSYGADVARELGRDLAAAGVAVVSGLALGVDGAAHEGALAGAEGGGSPPVGVVGSGLDVVYPPRHRALWRRVGEHGLLLSEAPPGARPDSWRFPRRNRVLAALAQVVVVVESHASGGSMSTVRAAIDRGITVMAVPGSVRSPSSAGTNRLLAEGVAPVTGAEDVLTALALEGVRLPPPARPAPSTGAAGTRGDPAPEADDLDATDLVLLEAVDWTPTTTEEILRRTGLPLAETSRRLVALEVRGVLRSSGGWWERVPPPKNGGQRGYTART